MSALKDVLGLRHSGSTGKAKVGRDDFVHFPLETDNEIKARWILTSYGGVLASASRAAGSGWIKKTYSLSAARIILMATPNIKSLRRLVTALVLLKSTSCDLLNHTVGHRRKNFFPFSINQSTYFVRISDVSVFSSNSFAYST